jgi:methylglutaconyl-CoA hydratase
MKTVLVEKQGNGIVNLILNRPEVHNAFDDKMISTLNQTLTELDNDQSVRVVLLSGQGKHFSAGADKNWMKRMTTYSLEENYTDALELGRLMKNLNNLSKPTIALVQGAAFGGGAGLIACCDIAIASEEASFRFSEVSLGLVPAVISPYVINAIGERAARRYFLTAEKFSAINAKVLGLIHEVTTKDNLTLTAHKFSDQLLANSPMAMSAAKALIRTTSRGEINDTMARETSRRIAEIRVSPEGQEGLHAFLQKRMPYWDISS